MDKVVFLPRLQRERDKFELFINHLGFARQLTMNSLPGRLSVKDLLADILSREQFISDRLGEIIHNESYAPSVTHSALDDFQNKFGYPDYESPLQDREKLNHLVVYKYKNVALDEVIAQESSAYDNIFSALEIIPEKQYLNHDLAHRVAEYTYKPYRRAMLDIKYWLNSISSESK
jgi:hypothetical protein